VQRWFPLVAALRSATVEKRILLPHTRTYGEKWLRHPDGLSLFTGRTWELEILHRFFESLESAKLRPPGFLLQICGVGGTGKSLLAQKAILEFRKQRPAPRLKIATLNLDSESWSPLALVTDFVWKLRESLAQVHIRTPLFDTLFAAWWSKAHSALEMKAEHPVLKELTEKVGDSAEFVKGFAEQVEAHIPGLVETGHGVTGVKLIGGLAKIRKAEARKRQFREFFGQLADMLTEGAAERNFARILFYDVVHFLKSHKQVGVCFVIDGFERVQSNESRFDPQFAFQEFCSLWVNASESEGRNRVGCVVLGRDQLDWDNLYPDPDEPWSRNIEIQLLPGLPESQARELIQKAARAYGAAPDADKVTAKTLEDEDTISNILRLSTDTEVIGTESAFNPFYVDLCIRQVKQVRAAGHEFKPADLGATSGELKRRFLDSMPKTCAGALQSLALALIFNEELFKHLVKEQQITGYGANQFAAVTNPAQTFLIWDKTSPGWYYFHRLMQEALFLRATETLQSRNAARQTAELILEYVQRQSRFSTIAKCRTEHLVHYRWGMDMLVYLARHAQLTVTDLQKWFVSFNSRFDSSSAAAVRVAYCWFLADFLENQAGPNDPGTLSALNDFATLKFVLGEYKDAEHWHELVLKRRENSLGPQDLSSLRTAVDLAVVKKHLGKLAKAEELLERALAGFSRALPADHSDLLSCQREMAAVLKRSKKYTEAEKLYRDVLGIQERVLGKRHLDTLRTLNDLAAVLHLQTKYSEAEPIYRRALAGFKRGLGATHRTTLICLSNLGEIQAVNKNFLKAEKSLKAALLGRRSTLGPDHPDTVESIYRLANFYLTKGDLEKAEPDLRLALEGFQTVFGEDHEYTKIAKQTLQELIEQKAPRAGPTSGIASSHQ
jgi:tetratricopeptide (TPR) repeat protein